MALLLKASKVTQGYPAEVVIEAGQLIIGRLSSNHLVIPGAAVEPIHAMIELDDSTGEASLIDMASDSGVKLNGRVIQVVENIKAGDVIQIGDVRITVSNAEKVAAAKTMPPALPGKGSSKEAPSDRSNRGGEKVQPTVKRSTAKSEAAYNYEEPIPKVPRVNYGVLFQPGKERPSGSTLEVVAFWDQSILDVRHYGGHAAKDEEPRANEVVIGNEDHGHLIGVGPKADTRNYRLANVDGSKTTVYLNGDMKARVRRGGQYDKVQGPAKFSLASKEVALIKHGPVSYFLMNVSLPNPVLRRFEDIDGKPFIFLYAMLVWGLLSVGMFMSVKDGLTEKPYDEDAWAQILTIRTPTPKPTQEIPAPKPTVVVKTPPPAPTPPKVATPKPTVAATKTPEKVVALKPKTPPTQETPTTGAPKLEQKNKDNTLSRKLPNPQPGNGGGAKGGTTGRAAAQRQGDQRHDAMGAEGGKPNVTSGINLDQFGAGMGKILDKDAVGAIATGLKSSSGGAGAGAGSGKRGSHGFGGLGEGASAATGGPAGALKGLGGGAGGFGSDGGRGGPGGNGIGGRKIAEAVVEVPEGDPAVEGGLTKEEIEAVIRANLVQIKACYERNLQGNRALAGRVLSNFVINPDGRVRSASIDQSTLNSPGTESCIAGAIRRWKFPLPRGGGEVSVKYPFVFSSR